MSRGQAESTGQAVRDLEAARLGGVGEDHAGSFGYRPGRSALDAVAAGGGGAGGRTG